MRKISRLIVFAVFTVTYLVLISGCNMPIGLGSRVNTDVPVIGLPDDDESNPPGTFLRGTSNIVEMVVEQEFGIDHVYMTIWYVPEGGGQEQPRRVDGVRGADGIWRFDIDTTGMADGIIRAEVTAVDVDGNVTTTPPLVYRVLNSLPLLDLILPTGLREYTGDFSRGLTSTVSFIGSVSTNVVAMYYALGATETAFVDGRDLEDNTGWTNTNLHSDEPSRGHRRWNAALNAHENFDDLSPERLTWTGNLDTGWIWRFLNIADIVDIYYVTPFDPDDIGLTHQENLEGGNLWVLPVKFRLVDAAGNISVRKISALIDPDADLPVTTVTSHAFRQIVGGPIRVSGTAEDNEVIHTVYMRIHRQADSDLGTDAWPGEPVQDWTPVALGHGSPFVSWAVGVNQAGELDPLPGHNRRLVLLEFRSRDAFIFSPDEPKGFGPTETLLLEFDDSVPIIGTPVILSGSPSEIGSAAIGTATGEYFDFAEGSVVSGFVTMRIIVRAPAGLQNIRLRSGAVNIDLLDGAARSFNDVEPWLSARRPFGDDGDEYTLFIPLNTAGAAGASLFGSGFAYTTHPLPLELQLADYTTPSPFTAQNNYMLRIDNRPPLGAFTGALNVINPLYTIAGQAWDHGADVTVQGIERVVVYFSRPGSANDGFGTPLTLTGGTSSVGSAAWITTRSAHVGRSGTQVTVDNEGYSRVLPFFPADFGAGGTGISIEALNTSGGFSGSLGSPPFRNWHVSGFDLSGFDNGPLTVNFVIFDIAGNATFYAQDIFLAIHRPVINAVYLGTNTGAGTVFAEPKEVGDDPVDAYFRVRNGNFTIRLDVRNPAGVPLSGGLTYDVAHVTLRQATAIPATQMVEGGVYRIATRGTATGVNAMNWVDYGVFLDLTTIQADGLLIDPVGVTFVATRNGSAASSGTVFAYDVPAPGPRRLQGAWTGPATAITFGAASFGATPALIPDSAKVPLPDGVNFTLQNDRFFLIRVTELTGAASITNTALVRVDIHNDDGRSPVINIAEFGQRSVGAVGAAAIANFADRFMLDLLDSEYNMNIVTNPANARRGYVQYAAHNTRPGPEGGRADISGRVIFRGNAADNDRVQSIAVSIGGAPPIQVAAWGTTGLEPVGGNTIAAMRADSSTAEWGFNASYQSNTLDYSHVFNWEFAWDSSRFPLVVGIDVPITFTVTDFAGLTASQTIHVNIVPYITEVVTPLSQVLSAEPSAFNRSARGWYPVREDDIITIRGFNLAASGVSVVALNGTTLPPAAPLPGNPADSSTQRTVSVGTTATSGSLVVTVGGVQSLNNRNNNTAHYNREPNNRNNNILTDDRYIYVWQTGFLLNAPVVTTPIMTMQPDSTWFLTYGRWGAGPIGVGSTAATTSQLRVIRSRGYGAVAGAVADTQVETRANRFVNMGIATDGIDWFIGATNITASGGGLLNFALHARESSGATPAVHATNRRALLRTVGSNMHRVRTPSFFAQNTTPNNVRGTATHATRVLVGFFDATNNNNALFFNYGLIGGASLTATAGFGGNFPSGSTTAFNDTSHLFVPAIPGPPSNPPLPVNAPQVVASNLTQHSASNYVAVGALANGRPVIAWFDSTRQNLVFSYGNNIPSTTSLAGGETSISNNSTEVWQNNARIIHSGAGTHVRMAIDGNDVIHLAYYDLINGGLFYARIYPTAIGNSPSMNGIHVARVDTHMAAGTRLSIAVRQETHNGVTSYVPYISYFHSSFGGTRNAIRVAWLRPDSTGNMSVRHGTFGHNTQSAFVSGHEAGPGFPVDSFTGEWEVMTVPASRDPLSRTEDTIGLVGIGVPSSGNFRAPTNSGGVPSPLASGWANNRSLRYSVLVGFMTTDHFEGAVLKHDIWQ